MKTIRKTCILKIAEMAPPGNADFAAAIEEAFGTMERAADRRLVLDDSPRRYRLLNDFFAPFGTTRSARGSVFAFTENQNLNGVVLRPNAGSYPMTVLSPPMRGKDRTEFVEGLTWFAAYGNYVAFFTDKAVFPSTLEHYFGWLLSEAARRRTGEDQTIAVQLRDPPRPELAGYDMTGVSSLEFRESVQTSPTAVVSRDRRQASGVLKPCGRAFEMLKALMKTFGAQPPRFPEARQPGQLDNLRVEMRVSCLRPQNGGAAVSAMKRTAERIRDAGAGSVSFRFSDGRTIDASDLAISTQMSISSSGGLPNTSEAVRKLDEWLMKQIEYLSLP